MSRIVPVTPNSTAPAAPRTAWLADVRAGGVDPSSLVRPHGHQWYDEDVAEVLAQASAHPGRDLVVSAHRGRGGAARTRLHRTRDSRWNTGRHRLRTHVLGTPRDPQRWHVVVLTDVGAGR